MHKFDFDVVTALVREEEINSTQEGHINQLGDKSVTDNISKKTNKKNIDYTSVVALSLGS